ncbi:unnamed protein product [Alopecurus aequalis]
MRLRWGPRRRSPRLLALGLDDGPDLISALPDDLLLLILARLECAAAAVRTGVLSRRWHGLWPRLRRFIFRDVSLPSLEAALGRFPPPPPAVSLLQIRCVPAGIEFPALETLSLSGCTADFDALLSRCPRLRTLRLADAPFHKGDLRINSPLLHELVVAGGNWICRLHIVAPVLKQLTMYIHLSRELNISILAPMMEKVLWDCSITGSTKFGFWRVRKLSLQTPERQGQLPPLHIHANIKFSGFYDEADIFTEDIEKHMIAEFSVLELHLTTEGHVFGAFVCHLIGMNRIRSAIQMLKIHLQRSVMKEEGCLSHCPCDSPDWKSQIISLTSLKEVEINGFEGANHEFDLLKLILRCAPLLKRINIKLSHEASASNVGCTKMRNIFMGHSSVACYIYLSSGSCIAAIFS